MSLPNCPKCQSEYTYEDGELARSALNVQTNGKREKQLKQVVAIKDANGNLLADGDTVTVIKDLKIKGSSSVVKVGTKVKNIRLLPDAADGHDIDCKIDGVGAMKLKSEYVKKA